MNKTTIERNELLLTDSMEERFIEHETPFGQGFMTVGSYDFDGLKFSIGDYDTGEEVAVFSLPNDQVELFIQAVLVHSGKVRVV
jgi:hypothetical protein